ncbi:EAL domain-containing protein [Pseudomonas sp. WS 5111]|uniref:EAL domain-containing response regulator n=1 Tax=unclassified Pseudomonas TaxID=196821 RepID=UPI001472916E|nr:MULTISPECIES: EAL domain-containing response regulator [unclassified Pseudomonas]NMX68134.1 EAL domain-containing protein [Pseudomonas sp. WS 5111]NMX68304.1 EAL domain-containing protein [Pseudomonas sp. WS 5111]NMX84051.1 EAL domain-containing protein [Pseudomonas sp. WS 5010]
MAKSYPLIMGRLKQMVEGCVLVIESHALQRSVLVNGLLNLQVASVVSAGNAMQAVDHIRSQAVIDIIFFDLADGSINNLEFLRVASELGNVRALVIHGELPLALRRSVEKLTTLSSIRLLGVLEKPLQLRALQKILSDFTPLYCSALRGTLTAIELIPRQQVLLGLMAGEFQAWYQPKFNLHDGRLFGAEVLVRWNHPQRGLLLPRDLLAAVVAYDLLDEMFKRLLDQGLELMSRLREQGFDTGLAFNLTASQLVSSDLVEHVIQRLHQYELPGAALMFEITENGLLDLPASAVENLLHLHQAGCGLSVDDFGIGFSSLTQLAHLPFNQLKLDGVFVRDVDDLGNRAVISSSVALARALKMDLVVENIENAYTLNALVDLGCSFGQGFHLAVPMSADDFAVWLQCRASVV